MRHSGAMLIMQDQVRNFGCEFASRSRCAAQQMCSSSILLCLQLQRADMRRFAKQRMAVDRVDISFLIVALMSGVHRVSITVRS